VLEIIHYCAFDGDLLTVLRTQMKAFRHIGRKTTR
jgi:hypothetical protein